MTVTGKTSIYGIIGSPVDHSLSPCMQNAAFAASGLDCCYVPFPVASGMLEEAVKGLRSLGIEGFNVTIPFKEQIIPFLDELSAEAENTGAVNAVKRDGKRLIGHNTDGVGLLQSISEDLLLDLSGMNILLIGAGGAARAAVAALCSARVKEIVIANRSVSRAESLLERFSAQGTTIRAKDLSVLSSQNLSHFDLVINSSSVGMHGSCFEGFAADSMKDGACLYDMVYVPSRTPLIAEAERCGVRCANGLGMLAGQGEAAFRWWFGEEPKRGIMKQALLTHLRY